MPTLLLIIRHAPYHSALSREALDMALACAVFDVDISLLFLGEGVWQLSPQQQPTASKSIAKALQALPLYDIDKIYVDSNSLQQRQLAAEQLPLACELLTPQQLPDFQASFDQVMVW